MDTVGGVRILRQWFLAIGALAGCGQGLPARPPRPAGQRLVEQAVLEVPHAPFDVVPAELGDADVLERIRHRVVVQRWGLAWPTHDGPPIGTEARGSTPTADIVPVIGELGRKIRIVVEDDNARFAIWIARDDAAETALAPLQLSDQHGTTTTQWIEPGAPLIATEGTGGLRHVELVDDMLALEAWANAKWIGNVWAVAPDDPSPATVNPGTTPAWTPARDGRPLIRIAQGAVLRTRADPRAGILATIKSAEFVVSVIARGPAFTEVEASRPFVRIRGFVDNAGILGPTEAFITHGHGSGHGFGMSHAARHEIPAGTCLYDKIQGDVIGVALEAQTRLGGRLEEDWALVYVDTPWNVASMYVKNLGTDPAQPPTWDSCMEPSHRR